MTIGGHQHIILGPKAIEPLAETRANHYVICELAKRLGAEHSGFTMTENEMIDATLQASGWGGIETLRENRWIECQPDFDTAPGFVWHSESEIFQPVAQVNRLPLNLLPDISYPSLTIESRFPGAAPAEVEALLSRPVEEAVGVVAGVQRITSISRPAGRPGGRPPNIALSRTLTNSGSVSGNCDWVTVHSSSVWPSVVV